MEKVIAKMCVQTAVYWGTPVKDGYGGYTYDAAVEIACRWENVKEVIRSSDGKEIISMAQVYVTQDIVEQGYLYLGSLDDSALDSTPIPTETLESFEILKFEKLPVLNSTTEFLRKAYL